MIDILFILKVIICVLMAYPFVFIDAAWLYYIWDSRIAMLLDPINCEDDCRELDFLDEIRSTAWNM